MGWAREARAVEGQGEARSLALAGAVKRMGASVEGAEPASKGLRMRMERCLRPLLSLQLQQLRKLHGGPLVSPSWEWPSPPCLQSSQGHPQQEQQQGRMS